MALYAPAFSGCTLSANGGAFAPATVTAACDWAHAVDQYFVSGGSSLRLGIGAGCPTSSTALTVTDGSCTVTLPSQVKPNVTGLNTTTATVPKVTTGMAAIVNVHTGLQRTIDPACGLLQDPIPLASMATTVKFIDPGVWASL